jgi:hypothetical protein
VNGFLEVESSGEARAVVADQHREQTPFLAFTRDVSHHSDSDYDCARYDDRVVAPQAFFKARRTTGFRASSESSPLPSQRQRNQRCASDDASL